MEKQSLAKMEKQENEKQGVETMIFWCGIATVGASFKTAVGSM